MFVDLALYRQQIRVDDLDTCSDALLEHQIAAAEQHLIDAYQLSPVDLLDRYGQIPAPVSQAVMMLAAAWYSQAEATTAGQQQAVPYGVEALIKPYCPVGDRCLERAKGGRP